MKRLASIATLCLASSLPAIADAANDNLNGSLRGDYAFTGEATCISSPPSDGFKSDFRATSAHVLSFNVEGVRRFNGDGTGTVSGRTVSFGHGGTSPVYPGIFHLGPVSTGTFSGDFTYTVARDRTIHIDQGPLTGIQVVGPNPGGTEVWTGIKIDGHVTKDFKTLTVASASGPDLASLVEVGHDTGGTIVEYRVCHRSRVLVRIGSLPGQDD